MATRLYAHNQSNSISGTFPTSKQGSNNNTVVGSMTTQSTNKTMDTSIGTSQASISGSYGSLGGYQGAYGSRFVSEAINQTSITAQTWTANWAAAKGATGWTAFPANSHAGSGSSQVSIYVWRPSTGAIVGTIADIQGGSMTSRDGTGETSFHTTVTGSSVTCQVNDVICWEMWMECLNPLSATTWTLYYDGNTVTSADNTSVSSHASYIETPQTIAFVPAIPASIDMTPTGKTNTNKIITKA